MRYLLVLLFFLLTIRLLYGQESPPTSSTQNLLVNQGEAHVAEGQQEVANKPLHTVPIVERNFINLLQGRSVTVGHITKSPVGINGRPNDVLRATYSGNERLCVNTGSGPGKSTTWSCVTLGAP